MASLDKSGSTAPSDAPASFDEFLLILLIMYRPTLYLSEGPLRTGFGAEEGRTLVQGRVDWTKVLIDVY